MHKVFLGVGHGGQDPGAAADGYQEKEITLTMALACKAELERYGVEVGISRVTDEDDPLAEEIRECNAFAPEVAVDLHVNAGGGDGFEAYYTLSGGVGKTLAENIEAQVVALGQNSRGCKTRVGSTGKDYYGFIRQTKCPAVICEIGFLDNASDRQAFDTAAEQQAFGRAYAHGILKTLGVGRQEVETVKVYRYVKDMPEWAQDAAAKAIRKGVVAMDAEGAVSIYECNLQPLVWMDRVGLLE